MGEPSNVADLGDEADRGHKRDAAQRLSGIHDGAHRHAGVSWRSWSVSRFTRRSVSSIVSRYSCSAMCCGVRGDNQICRIATTRSAAWGRPAGCVSL
jgi:hypothetical protein